MITFEHLSLSIQDSIAMIRLSTSSDRANLLRRPVLSELRECIALLAHHPDTRLVVLTGTGRVFSLGADIAEINGSTPTQVQAFLTAGQSALRQLMDLNFLTVAAVNGLALGGGLELALACDIRWAHTSAALGFPESRLGLLPGWGGVALSSRAAPASVFAEMIASGEFFGARHACDVGLVSRVFQDADFETEVLVAAQKLARQSAPVLAGLKALLRQLRGDVDLATADREFVRLWQSRPARLSGGETRRLA